MLNESRTKRSAVLIATHDFTFGIKLADWLAARSYQAVLVRSWTTMIDECHDLQPRAILIDFSCPDQMASPSLDEVLQTLAGSCPHTVVVAMGNQIDQVSMPSRTGGFPRSVLIPPATFSQVGRLLCSEITNSAAAPPQSNVMPVSRDKWTADGSAPDRMHHKEGPGKILPRICPRCHGLMHPIDPLDPLDALRASERDRMLAWRCISCGNLIDPVIIQNRHYVMTSRARRRGTSPRQPVFRGTNS